MTRHTGVVVKWLNHKGIGFITPDSVKENEKGDGDADSNASDILVHFQHIQQTSGDGFKSLQNGSQVEYDLEDDPKHPGEKMIAINVTGPGGVDCTPKRKGGQGGGASSPEGNKPKNNNGKKGKGKGKKGKKGKGKGKGGYGASSSNTYEGEGEQQEYFQQGDVSILFFGRVRRNNNKTY
ncbi:unnamed protein product [Amoebophrya sp. A120]|nr:unnamed protein product [Amoebophrya sp. A120]|eukprot:GSA120T00017331001.1